MYISCHSRADSSGRCNTLLWLCISLSRLHSVEQFDNPFGIFGPVKDLMRWVIEFIGDVVRIVLAVQGNISDFGEVLKRHVLMF